MRSHKYQDRVQKESTKLPRGSTAAKKLSTKTSVNVMDLEAPRSPVIDLITTGESARVAVAEILHLDPLVCQVSPEAPTFVVKDLGGYCGREKLTRNTLCAMDTFFDKKRTIRVGCGQV